MVDRGEREHNRCVSVIWQFCCCSRASGVPLGGCTRSLLDPHHDDGGTPIPGIMVGFGGGAKGQEHDVEGKDGGQTASHKP